MKFSTIIITAITAVFFTSCMSMLGYDTSSAVNHTSSGNMRIIEDRYAGCNTVTHKNIGVDFVSKEFFGTTSIYFEPCFTSSEDSVRCFLRIENRIALSSRPIECKQIVLLGETGRVIINPVATPEIEYGTSQYDTSVSKYMECISKKDYESLSEFFAENSKVKLGFYTSKNEIVEMVEESNRAHKIFAAAYSYYKDNLSAKKDISATLNNIAFVK